MSLFHKDIHPWVGQLNLGQASLDWTAHARLAAIERNIPALWTVKLSDVVECERNASGSVTKLLLRKSCPGRPGLDICLVIRPADSRASCSGLWLVITVWVNRTSDVHATLDKTKYNKAG